MSPSSTPNLQAQQAQAALAQTSLARLERLRQHGAVSEEEVDRARAERDIAQAQIARTEAIIAKKTIRAPFRARVGIADVHPGQYLNEGTQLTTPRASTRGARGFAVGQQVAASCARGKLLTWCQLLIRRRSWRASWRWTRASTRPRAQRWFARSSPARRLRRQDRRFASSFRAVRPSTSLSFR